jgi:phosphohistidine phosphatase
MQLYLIQHGTAKSREEDPDRPLTDEGRRQVEAVLLSTVRFGRLGPARVLHSGKRRARETAELVADRLDSPAEEVDGLAPDDDPDIWARRLSAQGPDLMLVGHLPHLSRLASQLLCGDSDREIVRFTNGGIVALEGDGQDWSLRWAISPELVHE